MKKNASLLMPCLLAAALVLAGCATRTPAPVVGSDGQPVVLPAPAAKDTYTVKSGDTLYSIAREHGMDHRELIAMNGPSLKRFEPRCRPGALVLVNSSQALEKVVRDDLRAFYIPSMEDAARLGNIKVANMIMLGAYIRATGALRIETLEKMLAHIFTGPKAHLVELNIKALQTGAGYIA